MAVTRLSVASSNSKTEKKPATSNSKTKKKRAKKVNMSYRIKGTNKVVKVNDSVFMRPSEAGKLPYVARVQKIEKDEKNNDVKVHCQWYYRPEESIMGRRPFHGARELFLSDHYDVQSARTIEGKCIVHDYTIYKNLKSIGRDDYYCRFEYKVATGAFNPDRVSVYCICEMPYNPDDPMVGCDACKDWFHPACLGMTIEEAKKLKGYVCAECSTAEEVRRSQNGVASSPPPEEIKVEAKRRRRR